MQFSFSIDLFSIIYSFFCCSCVCIGVDEIILIMKNLKQKTCVIYIKFLLMSAITSCRMSNKKTINFMQQPKTKTKITAEMERDKC